MASQYNMLRLVFLIAELGVRQSEKVRFLIEMMNIEVGSRQLSSLKYSIDVRSKDSTAVENQYDKLTSWKPYVDSTDRTSLLSVFTIL